VAVLSGSECPVRSLRDMRGAAEQHVFVHITAVERAGLKDLTEGQRITFEVEPDKKGKGPKAVNLVISS
jgi:cold shock CspA family protein